MFRQTGTLSAFQIQLTLPCNEDEWYAHSATEWYKIHQTRPEPPPFLTTMKAFLMPGLNSPEISPLARVICLHGLLSVAFDMQWREYFLLGLSTHSDGLVKDWRPTLVSFWMVPLSKSCQLRKADLASFYRHLLTTVGKLASMLL